MKNAFVLLVFFYSTALISQSTIVLQPDAAAGKDARIFNLNSLANFGNDVDFIASILDYSGEPGTTRSLIQFDLSSIPEAVDIIDARLSLYHNPDTQTPGQLGDNAAYLRRIIQPWEESTVAWNMQPLYSTDNQVLIPASANPTQDYENIDVTALVSDMVEFSSSSFGFMFMLENEQGMRSMKFYSSDGPNPDKHPRLQVTYGTVANKEIQYTKATIQPNPFSSSFVIRDLTGVYQINITDMSGNVIHSSTVEANGNDVVVSQLGNLPAGIYLLNAIGSAGNYFSKIIKTSE